MEVTPRSPLGVTVHRLQQKINTGKIMPTGGDVSNALSPYFRVLLLLAFVVGGLFLIVLAIMFCSYCIKKIKELRRSVEASSEVERGPGHGLLQSLRRSAVEKARLVQAFAASQPPVQLSPTPQETNPERQTGSVADNYIDYAFAKYKELHPDPDDEKSESHVLPRTSSSRHRDADDDVSLPRGSKVIPASSSSSPPPPSPSRSSSSSPTTAAVAFPRKEEDYDDVIGSRDDDHLPPMDSGVVCQRRRVSFELREKSMSEAGGGGGGQHQKPVRGSIERLSNMSPVTPRPKPRTRCQTMDPKDYHHYHHHLKKKKGIEVKAEVHRGRMTSPCFHDDAVAMGVQRDAWVSATLENRKLVLVEEAVGGRPYWNSLEFQSERKPEGGAARLVNSYDEQMVLPPKHPTFHDPLRITEFLNGPCGDEELGGRGGEIRFPPKRMKVFESGVSFDQGDLGVRTGDVQDSASTKATRLDSIRKDSAIHGGRRQSTFGRTTFRGIAMSRTIDIPDRDLDLGRDLYRDLARSFEGQKKSRPLEALEKPEDPEEKSAEDRHQDQSLRRQAYGHAFAKGSRGHDPKNTTEGHDPKKTTEGNSFDSVATDVDQSESSHCEVTTTSIESSTTTASTDSQSDARSSHKLHQMRDDSGYKSLETQQSMGKNTATGTQSLDVQVMQRARLSRLVTLDPRLTGGQSLDSQLNPAALRGEAVTLSDTPNLKALTKGVKNLVDVGVKNREQESDVSSSAAQSTVEVKTGALAAGSETGAPVEENAAAEDQRKRGFLSVSLFEVGGLRGSLTKAKSQDFVPLDAADPSGEPCTVPSSASSIFPISFEKFLHRAEHYLSTAAENLLSMGARDETPTRRPAAEEEPTTGKPPGPEEPPAAIPPVEKTVELETGSGKMFRAGGGSVLRPAWSQLIAEKEGKTPGGGPPPFEVPVLGSIRRGDLKTASKKRREWRSRRQLTEICDSSAADILSKDPSALEAAGPFPPLQGEGPHRSLTMREYSLDEKALEEFTSLPTNVDDAFMTSATSRVTSSPEIERHHHSQQHRSVRKAMNPILEMRKSSSAGQGQIQGQGHGQGHGYGHELSFRSLSLDMDRSVGAKPTRFSNFGCYTSIAEEETQPQDSDS